MRKGACEIVVIDIETGSLPLDRLKEIMPPFDPSTIKHPGEFDPSAVKCGNIGGPESVKGKAKIEEARKLHEASVAEFESKLEDGYSNYWKKIEEDAALSAMTGEVLAIGYDGKSVMLDHAEICTEAQMLTRFWEMFSNCRKQGRKIVGFSISEFDIPYLFQRSIILGLDVPKDVFIRDRYLSDTFVDTRTLWLGSSMQKKGRLDNICRACGIGSKPDGISGADFAGLYRNPETRPTALDYLANDLAMAKALAIRLGLS